MAAKQKKQTWLCSILPVWEGNWGQFESQEESCEHKQSESRRSKASIFNFAPFGFGPEACSLKITFYAVVWLPANQWNLLCEGFVHVWWVSGGIFTGGEAPTTNLSAVLACFPSTTECHGMWHFPVKSMQKTQRKEFAFPTSWQTNWWRFKGLLSSCWFKTQSATELSPVNPISHPGSVLFYEDLIGSLFTREARNPYP